MRVRASLLGIHKWSIFVPGLWLASNSSASTTLSEDAIRIVRVLHGNRDIRRTLENDLDP